MRSGLLALLVLSASASAWAQAPDLDRARRHFEAGSQAFQRGDYPRAELEFRGAYAITKDPLLFYNIGQSQQRRGHLEAAIKSYRSYLAGVPDAEDRGEVEGIIRNIEKEMTAPKGGGGVVTGPGDKPVRGPGRRSDDDSHARRQSAWIVGAVSVAMLAVGGAMSGLSWKKAADANKILDRRDAFGQPVPYLDVQTDFNAKRSDAATFGGVAIGMYAAAVVGLGISTYLFITSRPGRASKEKREARLRLVPVLDPRNAGLVAGMEF